MFLSFLPISLVSYRRALDFRNGLVTFEDKKTIGIGDGGLMTPRYGNVNGFNGPAGGCVYNASLHGISQPQRV
jgi:hypothetical protein